METQILHTELIQRKQRLEQVKVVLKQKFLGLDITTGKWLYDRGQRFQKIRRFISEGASGLGVHQK
jgi:hypothetical protein